MADVVNRFTGEVIKSVNTFDYLPGQKLYSENWIILGKGTTKQEISDALQIAETKKVEIQQEEDIKRQAELDEVKKQISFDGWEIVDISKDIDYMVVSLKKLEK